MCFWFRKKKVEKKEEVVEEKINEPIVKDEVKPVEVKETEVKPISPTKPVENKPATKKSTKKVVDKKDDVKEEVVEETSTPTEAKKMYHVVKRASDNKWCVKFAGGKKVIKLFDTKPEALAYVDVLAANQNGGVYIHASKGKSKGKIIKK